MLTFDTTVAHFPDALDTRADPGAPRPAGASDRGTLGAGTYYIEYERDTIRPDWAREKLGPYRKMAAAGRALPLLMVC